MPRPQSEDTETVPRFHGASRHWRQRTKVCFGSSLNLKAWFSRKDHPGFIEPIMRVRDNVLQDFIDRASPAIERAGTKKAGAAGRSRRRRDRTHAAVGGRRRGARLHDVFSCQYRKEKPMMIDADPVPAPFLARAVARASIIALCLAAAGCSTFERQVIAPPTADNPMTRPPAGLMDPCAGLNPTQRAATQGCGVR
jgi:hypothetical protein